MREPDDLSVDIILAGSRAHIEINRFNSKNSLKSMNFCDFGILLEGSDEEWG